jgi:hypothetical protein
MRPLRALWRYLGERNCPRRGRYGLANQAGLQPQRLGCTGAREGARAASPTQTVRHRRGGMAEASATGRAGEGAGYALLLCQAEVV